MIRQTANEIAAEVSDARGDVSALQLKVAENTATASLVAKVVDTEGNIKGASIVQAVNASGSSSTISADHIVLNGYNISNGNGSFQINEGGHMIATGGSIAGWQISGNWISKAREVNGKYDNGNTDKRITDNDKGTYTVLMSSQMYDSNSQNLWSPPAFAVQKVKNNSIEYPFLVRSNGELTATKAQITGDVEAKTFKAHLGTNVYMTCDNDRLAFWGTSKKPHVSIGYSAGSNNAHIILGTGVDSESDTRTNRFYITKDGDGGHLISYNGSGVNNIGSRISLLSNMISLKVGNALCELDEAHLYKLNNFLRFGTMPTADE
jgi:PBP1b-binding outer membrane lipoprotein LpoB